MPNRRMLRLSTCTVICFAQMLLVPIFCESAAGAAQQFQVVGRWQGKFPLPDDQSISEDENPIAVEITVKEDSGKLSGFATFYVIRTKDGKPQIVNKKDSEMIAPQFDGKVLKFSVKAKGSQPGTETTMAMRMTLTNATEAELETPADSSAAVFKMKKVQSR